MADARALRPEPTCGTEPPYDPEGCGHDHHGSLVCGEIVDTAWSGEGPEPVYCEHIDRRYATWLERAFLAQPATPVGALDVEPHTLVIDEDGTARLEPEWPAVCRTYWGSHGCDLPRNHRGPHQCNECWNPDDTDGYVGAWPYYGPDTRFFGEDAAYLAAASEPAGGGEV